MVESEVIKELENNPLGVNFRVLVFLDWRDPRMKCGWENACLQIASAATKDCRRVRFLEGEKRSDDHYALER